MSLPISCPNCGHALPAEAVVAGTLQHCPVCGLEFEITIHVAPRQVEEVVAMLVEDELDEEGEIEFPDEATDAVLFAAAPAPLRREPRALDWSAEVTSPTIADDRIARYRAEHRQASHVPRWGWVAMVSISVLPLVAWAWNFRDVRNDHAQPQRAQAAAVEAGFDQLQHAKFRESDEPLADVYQALELGIVKIETRDAEGRASGVGTGIVIDDQGLVATCFHVLSDSVVAEAIFNDGSRCRIAGYAAVSPGHDLAIVKLHTPPTKMTVLNLGDEGPPRKATRVVAIGHPQNHAFLPTSGIVGRIVRSSQLPPKAQQFLRYAPAGQDSVWIEHDAAISSGSSGGPLVDYRGAVLGINTWFNPEMKLGYALHVQHLNALRREVKSPVVPLGEYRPE